MDSIQKSIVDNIDSYTQLGKNHKLMRKCEETSSAVYQISKGKARVQYVVDELGTRTIIKVFNKENHQNSCWNCGGGPVKSASGLCGNCI